MPLKRRPISGVRDSKTLSAAQRERLAGLIVRQALAVGLGAASVTEIDQLNIYYATTWPCSAPSCAPARTTS